jgi:hypothetical protein
MHPWFSRTYSELRAEYGKRPLHQAYIRQNCHLQTELQNELRPEARKVFRSRDYSRARYVNDITFRPVDLVYCSLLSIGGDTTTTKAGVYLHILWSKDNSDLDFLYVGQSFNISERIQRQHYNPTNRQQHRSFHYRVWERLLKDPVGMNEVFVILATDNERPDTERLSLQEVWSALVLQTLPYATFRSYLPK